MESLTNTKIHIIAKLKIKPVDIKSKTHILTLVNKLILKVLNLKLVLLLEYQNVEKFLQKTMFQVGLKKFL